MNWGEMNSIRGCDINRHCALFLLSCIDLRISGRVGGWMIMFQNLSGWEWNINDVPNH